MPSLANHPHFAPRPGPVVLCILDGVGIGSGGEDDAVHAAHTPTLDALRGSYPTMALAAHGTAVGLPSDKDLGNSEVGHNAMGAGRVFQQGASLVNDAIADGSIFRSDVWTDLVRTHTLHLMGLTSSGNVHSHTDHLAAMIDRAASDGVKRLRVHVLTDGRDVPARSALTWIEPLEAQLAACRRAGLDYRIASGGGRMHITMDRYEADWAMVERGWRCHVEGVGAPFPSASAAVRALYDADPGVDDQYLPAFVCVDDAGAPCGPIRDGDGVIFFNFRGDRAIEITRAFEDDDFTAFARGRRPDVVYAGMMQYDGDLALPSRYLVAPPAIDHTVGEYLAQAKLSTFACSETQKFGHVTYFFNGNRSGRIDDKLERYLEVPSDTVPFDQRPWMKAAEITDAVIAAVQEGSWNHIRLNYANGDMVGHTGSLRATRMALEAVDLQLARLHKAVSAADGVLLVTADHGNADEMYLRKNGQVLRDASGTPSPRTAHSLNPVPLIVADPRRAIDIRRDLAHPTIAGLGATVLALCGLKPPADYLPALVTPRG